VTAHPAGANEIVVLGAGYAGVTVCHEIRRVGKRGFPTTVVDRHPSHTLRTRLYEVGRLAEANGRSERWSVPIDRVLGRDGATFVEGEVGGIDLDARTVQVGPGKIPFRALAICLGSVAAYYGVPGAEEHTEQVYRFAGAVQLAERLTALARTAARANGSPPRVVVVGGGSTGTEVAAEIATVNWSKVIDAPTPPMEVTLVVGALPLLAGLPEPLIRHATRLLAKARVRLLVGINVSKVEPRALTLQDGQVLPADAVVWCAGLETPAVVRELNTSHGKGGRLLVNEHLELPEHPGVFAVGDVVEFRDPRTGLLVPSTAQAALVEAPVAGRNIVAHLTGGIYAPFHYRERGVVVSVGRRRGAGRVAGVTIWGRPAALLKAALESDYAAAASRGREAPGL
jgi:NADH dehydrogenase